MPPLNKIKGIGPENSIKLFLNKAMIVLIKYTFQDLRYEINHRLKEVLILEDHLALAVTQQYAHIDITDLLALFLQVVGFIAEFFEAWLVAFSGLELRSDFFDVRELLFVLDEEVHVVVELLQQVVEEL
jgi:hypothetical protein